MASSIEFRLKQLLSSLGVVEESIDETLVSYISEVLAMEADGDHDNSETLGLISTVLSGYFPAISDSDEAVKTFVQRCKQGSTDKAPSLDLNDSGAPEVSNTTGALSQGVMPKTSYGNNEDGDMSFLTSMLPDVPEHILKFTLERLCRGDIESAAARLLEKDGLREATTLFYARQEEIARSEEAAKLTERAARDRVLSRFADQIVGSDVHVKPPIEGPVQKRKEKEQQIRFRDGKVVTTTGQKYIEWETTPEWDGGSRGRVKTKGKRGKGFV